VILGSGWAGYGFARTLDPNKFERIMISPRSYFVFTPLLAGASVGTLEFRAVLESVRRLGLDKFHQGWADDIDFANKTIRVEANTTDDLASRTHMAPNPSELEGKKGEMFDIPYDKLVVAVGSYTQTFGTEGVKQYANFLRDVADARKIRMKVLQLFEKAALPTTTDEQRKKLLHFAVVGGGPTGIEFAAELHDLIRDDLSKMYHPDLMKFVGITVYDIAPKVLPMFDQTLADYAMETFKREGIAVKTEHHLTRIRPDEETEGCLKLRIKEYDHEVNAGIVVWSTGLMQNPLVEKMGEKVFYPPAVQGEAQSRTTVQIQRDPKTSSIITDPHLRVNTVSYGAASGSAQAVPPTPLLDVFAIGDCAAIDGNVLPATAQVASQKATHLAKRLNRGDVDAKEFKFRNWGTMTYVGNWKAIHQSSADDIKGWAAWVLWRTAYLTKSMSIRNKIMVPIYWVISWMFGRDISRF
jgi:NADH dehydrogenase FAD-containing subunit